MLIKSQRIIVTISQTESLHFQVQGSFNNEFKNLTNNGVNIETNIESCREYVPV